VPATVVDGAEDSVVVVTEPDDVGVVAPVVDVVALVEGVIVVTVPRVVPTVLPVPDEPASAAGFVVAGGAVVDWSVAT
jgi:hypothetical protein